MRALILYDAIIDDIFTYTNTTIGSTAKRLGKSPSTISLVVRSDFFRARWLQRREQFNEDLNFRLTSKIAAVAEKSLDSTLQQLKDKTNVPLPMLNEINKTLLDRLGYAPGGGGGPSVVVNNNNSAQAAAVANGQASPEGLAKAREYLRVLECSNAASGQSPGNAARFAESRDLDQSAAGPVVEGEAHRVQS